MWKGHMHRKDGSICHRKGSIMAKKKSKRTAEERIAAMEAIKDIIDDYRAELAAAQIVVSLAREEVKEVTKVLREAKKSLKAMEKAKIDGDPYMKAEKRVEYLQERLDDAEWRFNQSLEDYNELNEERKFLITRLQAEYKI